MRLFLFLFSSVFCVATALSATEVDRLLGEYGQINTATCHIRRIVKSEAGETSFISRVYWKNDDHLHVENLAPIPRRIISDSSTFFSYVEGDPKGFSRSVDDLSKPMLFSLRKIPGTAMDHLLRLKGLDEQRLDSNGKLHQIAYDTGSQYVVLGFDSQHRLVTINFFKTAERTIRTASYRYSNFKEVVTGIWIPLIHEATLYGEGIDRVSETIHLDRLVINQPVAVSWFDPKTFFDKEVDFVDSFAKIYGE